MNRKSLGVALVALLLSACSLVEYNTNDNTVSSSLVSFLYPDEQSRVEHQPDLPRLTLPVKVGVSFVPSGSWQDHAMSDAEQMALLEQIKGAFTQYDYIDRIEVIPSTYLKTGKGFDTLDQLSRLYDIDVMALVSYDQITKSQENTASLLYWTIVGLYLIEGNDHSSQTFVDTAVFDIRSRTLLFRAPGLSKLDASSTAVHRKGELDKLSMEGFTLAVEQMTLNLDKELHRFETRVKEEKIAKVETRPGYNGSSLGGGTLLTAIALLGWRRRYLSRGLPKGANR
ncbi:rhombotail lipoprotein [Ferrimonas sediminum]|uniref:Rhombotail lipoprotein n=1 Tax=Ferrimonas sediminum TaxID=718193 RepID=A0A1G8LTH4_9GAMM|nr:rhombotarget lipoprotein [Ferrimonas sediminum]SDI58946.1 rhombotail lipoprotein [Ferrimonas sediminum]